MDYGCWYLLSRSCADTNPTASTVPTCCMYGFDSVMGLVLGICSDNEFGWGSYIELGDTWYTWRMGRFCHCVVQQRHVVDFG